MKKFTIFLVLAGALFVLARSLSLSPRSLLGFIFAEEKAQKDLTVSLKETAVKSEGLRAVAKARETQLKTRRGRPIKEVFVEIVDAEENVVREIPIGYDYKEEIVPGPERDIQRGEGVKVIISGNGQFIGIVYSNFEYPIFNFTRKELEENPESESVSEAFYKVSGKFSLMDIEGKILWERFAPQGKKPDWLRTRISETGHRIVLVVEDNWGKRDELFVYDQEGKDDFRLSEGEFSNIPRIWLTQNGRYLLIEGRIRDGGKSRGGYSLFDLDENAVWGLSKNPKSYRHDQIRLEGSTIVLRESGKTYTIDREGNWEERKER